MSTPSEQEVNDLNDLAKLIYVERLSHLGANHWDFRPIAARALDAAAEFYSVLADRASVPSDQKITLATVEQGQSPGVDPNAPPPPSGQPAPADASAVPVGTEPSEPSEPPIQSPAPIDPSQPSQTQAQTTETPPPPLPEQTSAVGADSAPPVHPAVPDMPLPPNQPAPVTP